MRQLTQKMQNMQQTVSFKLDVDVFQEEMERHTKSISKTSTMNKFKAQLNPFKSPERKDSIASVEYLKLNNEKFEEI